MKNIVLIVLILLISFDGTAQYREMQPKEEREEEPKGGFKKDHLFTGGGVQLSLSNYSFVIGASPIFGYSVNKWLDAGVGLNFTYISDRHVIYTDVYTGYSYLTDDKAKQTDIAPLIFARFYPVKFLFIQAQGEHNFISEKYIYASGGEDKIKYNVSSLLLGAGYCSGRQDVGDFFYYLSISIDVLKNKKSPYVDRTLSGTVNFLPIIRAGIQIPLFQGGRNRGGDD